MICGQNQALETDGNGKTTLEKWGKDPPDVPLNKIVKDLLSYLKGSESLSKTGKNIENKYNIKNEHGDCWPEDDIKRAWGKTQRMDIKSEKRNRWACVIMLQIVKRRLIYDECKQNSAQEDHEDNADSKLYRQAFEKTLRLEEHSEDTSQSNDELQIWRAAGEAQPPFAAGPNTSKYKRTEESAAAASESVLFDSSSDGDLSLPESRGEKHHTNSNSSEATIYIRIPLSEMFDNDPTFREQEVQNVPSEYKLINGFPSYNDIRRRKCYALSYNNDTHNAEWVYEILNVRTLANNIERPESDGDVYHNGHLAAAANHRWCHEASNEASLLINISPQHSGLNNSTWKTLENRCRRKLNNNLIHNVHVYTGPLYHPGQADIPIIREKKVPTHFFKVIIVEKRDGTVLEPECYKMPNETPQSRNFEDYRVNIEEIERLSGLNFRERNPAVNGVDRIKRVTWQGEDLNGQQLEGIKRSVRISS